MAIYVPNRKAGPIGPGAGVLNTEYLLPNVLTGDANQRMAKYVQMGTEVGYIRAAEATIGGQIADPLAGVAWHLEDPDEETIDDAYPGDPRAKEAYELITNPMGTLDRAEVGVIQSRNAQWEITSRHMGLAGQGAWYLDGINTFGTPKAIIYVRPDRLTPVYATSSNNQLDHWQLDRRPGYEGTRLEPNEIIIINLQTPDMGVWSPGLVESAMTKAMLNGAIDRHFSSVLQSGGRLAGILSPKTGLIDDDGIFNQMTRDWRNITEQPDSARRLQVVRAPIDFTKTAATIAELALVDLMTKNRDDLLALWRVPLSQIGGSSPAGLNSGDVRKYDKAALWENAITPRLSRISVAITEILDTFETMLGWAPTIEFDIPEFDDDSPRYDKVQKAQFIALTNDERRGLIGFDPLPEELIGPTGKPLGGEVWTGISIFPVGGPTAATPNYIPRSVSVPSWAPESAEIVSNESTPALSPIDTAKPVMAQPMKADPLPLDAVTGGPLAGYQRSMRALKQNLSARVIPQMRGSVSLVLDAQKRDIAGRVRGQYERIKAKPSDTTLWWPPNAKWDEAMVAAIKPALLGVAEHVRTHVGDTVMRGRKADPLVDSSGNPVMNGAITQVLTRGAAKVTGINKTTRDGINDLVVQGIEQGMGPAELGDAIEAWSGFDEYRSELIARTETGTAYNAAALGSYSDFGIEMIQVLDGDGDDICAPWADVTVPITEAPDELGHPNAVLGGSTFIPYGGLLEMRRAWYDGPAMRVTLAGDRTVTIGPNHPMLAEHGMTPARLLEEGQQLVYDLRHDDLLRALRTGELELEQVPAIEQVFESILPGRRHVRIAAAGDDFHHDGVFCQGEVDVVWPAGKLAQEWDLGIAEESRELVLAGAGAQLATEARKGASLPSKERVLLAASGGMSGAGAGHFALLPIVAIEATHWIGWAYDASAVDSLYCSSGFVVTNCTRDFLPVI